MAGAWQGRTLTIPAGARLARADYLRAVSSRFHFLRFKCDPSMRLVMLVVSQNSVLGDSVVRTALIWALAEATAGGERKDLGKAEALRGIGRRIGVRAAWQELAVPLDRLKRLLEEGILPRAATVASHAP